MKSVGEMAELVEGLFVFTILDEHNNLYFVKGDNPLALYHYEKYGFYIYASTEAILDRALAELRILSFEHFVVEIEEMLYHPGEFEQALSEILDECAFDYCGEW